MADLTTWASPRISRLLPIDEESLKEVIQYAASLSKADAAEHLKNILGDSPQAFEFVSAFNARRTEVAPTSGLAAAPATARSDLPSNQGGVPKPRRNTPKKQKPSLHSAGPVRQPEGYGDVTGGYHKSHGTDSYAPAKKPPSATSLSNALALSQEPDAVQLPKVVQKLHTPSPSSSRDSSPPRSKLPPSASGNLISDLPNVKTKQARKSAHQSGVSTPHKTTGATTTTSSIDDITAAIAALELSTNPSLSTERRRCPCNAAIHPLFTTAPNCLSCGKIICALEGLQPCSFCDSPILTKDQVQSMIQALKQERGQERMVIHNTATSHSGAGTPRFGGLTPEGSGDEGSSAAAKARAHRDKLLAFQRENAQRTTVHDEAADYDMTLTPGTTQWMSPVQRAAALKKQQKYIREMEENNKPEWERKKTVMSMSVKNGKLVKTFERVKAPVQAEDEDEEVEEHAVPPDLGNDARQGAFSKNPLLADSKLIRPIWKAPEGDKGKAKEEEASTRKSMWRRVQDDNDDNEQWILDGGIHGFEGGNQEDEG